MTNAYACSSLSLPERGLLWTLLSKKADYPWTIALLLEHCPEGRDALNTQVERLENRGLLLRVGKTKGSRLWVRESTEIPWDEAHPDLPEIPEKKPDPQKGDSPGTPEKKRGGTLYKDSKNIPSWCYLYADTAHRRLVELGRRQKGKGWNREKWAETFDKLHRLDKHPISEIQQVMRWLLRPENWWIENRRFYSILRLREVHYQDEISWFVFFLHRMKAEKEGRVRSTLTHAQALDLWKKKYGESGTLETYFEILPPEGGQARFRER